MFWPVEDEMVQINRGESEMNDRSGHISLDVHLEAQARRLTDQCTLCGKCVERLCIRTLVHEAAIDYGS